MKISDKIIDYGLKLFFVVTSLWLAWCMTYGQAHAGFEDYRQVVFLDTKSEILDFYNEVKLNNQDRKLYEGKRDSNKAEADFYFARADGFWIPQITCREAADAAWKAALSQCAGGTPQSKLCRVIIVLLAQAGINCYDAWKKVTDDLQRAEYHYELYEWYDHVLKNDR